MEEIERIWTQIKDSVSVTKEEFIRRVEELRRRIKWKVRMDAVAYIVAKELGGDVYQTFLPPKRGRILEIGPVKISERINSKYSLFVLVNEQERLLGCVFGEEMIKKIKQMEDKVIEITNYTMAPFEKRELFRVTEQTEIRELDENALPPLTELKPAIAPSLEEISKKRGTHIVSGVVIDEYVTEYDSCPICKRGVTLTETGGTCGIHGIVDPEGRKVYHYQIADETGIFPAVFFGDITPESLFKKRITIKGYFKSGELQINKFYSYFDVL